MLHQNRPAYKEKMTLLKLSEKPRQMPTSKKKKTTNNLKPQNRTEHNEQKQLENRMFRLHLNTISRLKTLDITFQALRQLRREKDSLFEPSSKAV